VVEHKDVVLAILGASAGLSGLVLVFLGLVVAAYGGLAGDTPSAVRTPLRRTGWVIFLAFALGIACVAVATVWLLRLGGNQSLYVATASLFVVQLVALVIASAWTLKELLWD
jgi:uncharacterized membrane protein